MDEVVTKDGVVEVSDVVEDVADTVEGVTDTVEGVTDTVEGVTDTVEEVNEDAKQVTPAGTFTQEEVNEIVKSRLSRKDEEFNKKLDKLVSERIAEEKRQAELTEEQKEVERLETLKAELEAKQRELDFRDRFSETEVALREVNLDARFAQWLVSEDKDTTDANIKAFQRLFDEAVEGRSVDKLKGKTPTSNTKPNKKGITVEEFRKMGYSERIELKRKDPQLYTELSK